MTFKEQIEKYLGNLPSKWKDQLVAILCEIKDQQSTVDCDTVRDCETLTSLSNFTVNGTVISITYKDEHSVQVTRSFDIGTILNGLIDDLDPNCLTDSTTWSNLSYAERLQLLIDAHCACCIPCLSAPTLDIIPFNTCIADPGTGGTVVFNFTLIDQDGDPVSPTLIDMFSDPLAETFEWISGSTFTYTVTGDQPLLDLKNNIPVIRVAIGSQISYLPLILVDVDEDCE